MVSIFVFYMEDCPKIHVLRDMLISIWNCSSEEIGELLDEGNHKIYYEIRTLEICGCFSVEVNLFVHDVSLILENKIYNNLILGIKVSNFMGKKILVDDESDDPLQWILIRMNKIFLAEEIDNECKGIKINNMGLNELSLEKSLKLLPNRKDVINELTKQNNLPYRIKPSSLWNNCLK